MFIVYFLSSRTSGQTWLQLQQQKLRAKKEQQNNGAEYFARNTDIRNRPLRYVLQQYKVMCYEIKLLQNCF